MRLPNKHNGYAADGSRQYHKGGDGGAKAAQQQEADRQNRIQMAVDKINAIFDSKPYGSGVNVASAFDPNATYYDSNGNVWKAPTTTQQKRINDGDSWNIQNNEVLDMNAINKAIQAGSIFTGQETITPGKTRQQLYDEQKQAVFDINKRDVDRQYANAERANRFGLARNGLMGGQADIDSNAELQRVNSEGLIKAAGLGDSAAADLKSADERSRQSLISMAQSGIDTGTAQSLALRNLDATAQSAAGQRAGASIGGLFDNMSQAYLVNQYMKGMNSGINSTGQWYPNMNTRTSYSGAIT